MQLKTESMSSTSSLLGVVSSDNTIQRFDRTWTTEREMEKGKQRKKNKRKGNDKIKKIKNKKEK